MPGNRQEARENDAKARVLLLIASVLRRQFGRPSSVLCPLSSVLCPLSSGFFLEWLTLSTITRKDCRLREMGRSAAASCF